MNISISQIKQELLSFCRGEPIIATLNSVNEHYDEYSLQIFVRSISDHKPTYIQSVQLRLIIPVDNPRTSPIIRLHRCELFHPNFSASGDWSDNSMRQDETMADYLMRLVRVLQYKEINADKVSNRNAMAWYYAQICRGIFPTDRINYNTKPRIILRKDNT